MTDPVRDDVLARATLVYVAPRPGSSGVSDYADDVLAAARPRFRDVVEVRCNGAGQDSALDVLRGLRSVRRAVRAAEGPVLLHTEQSGGVLLPFWSLAVGAGRGRSVRRSSTLHDAPLGVWMPLRTRGVGRSRLLVHALHFPTMPLIRRWERRVLRDVALSALTTSGARAVEREMRHGAVDASFLPPSPRPELPAPEERPLAVGLFGYVYRGKGFDSLARLRRLVDPRIEIRVAGRGTEGLEPLEGVTVLGGVEGRAEDDFFASVRAIAMPYSRRSSYGPTTHVASSVLARAISYGTPVLALRYPGLGDEAEAVEGGPEELAEAINRLVADPAEVARLGRRTGELRRRLTLQAAGERLAASWRRALSGASPGRGR